MLQPGGMILWYDLRMNNPRNANVRAVSEQEMTGLFPDCTIHAERLTLAPPIARAVAPLSTVSCELLALIPWLRTHTLAAIRPR